MSDSGVFGGMLGRPGVRVTERGGGAENELRLPLRHGLVIGLLILVACLIVVPLLMALIGRGLLLFAVFAALVYLTLRAVLIFDDWRATVALGALSFGLMWAWTRYAQPVVELWWVPVWWGMPEGDVLPVRVLDGAWMALPASVMLVRCMAVIGVALGYAVPAWLILQRFGIEILMPQLLAVVPNPVDVRVKVPGLFRHIEQEHYDAEPEPPVPTRPALVIESVDEEPHEQEVASGVWSSNGTGNSRMRTELTALEPQQWDTLSSYVLSGRSWSGPEVGAGRILTTPQYRSLTRDLLRCGFLEERKPGNPRGGYAWTRNGRRFLEHRWWEHL